ncbi:MAG: signal peptidase II [Candidatus Kapaibacterium sp.]
MPENKRDSNLFFYWLAGILVLSDQITKLAIKGFSFFGIEHEGLRYGEQIPVIGDFLQITYIENPGMAFGISFGAGKIFLSLFSIFAGIGLYWYLSKLKGYSKWVRLGITLIFAGAVGNLIDRVFYGVIFGEMPLFYGKVVDFIQVDIPDINIFGLYYTHWPIFNIADSCVTVGVILLLFFHNKLPGIKEIRQNQKTVTDKESEDSNLAIDEK